MGFFIDFLIVVFKRVIGQAAARGSDAWPLAEGTVTAPPRGRFDSGRQSIEIVYSYRFQGELYTGSHEQSFVFGRSLPAYVKRFGKEAAWWSASSQKIQKYPSCAKRIKARPLSADLVRMVNNYEVALSGRIRP